MSMQQSLIQGPREERGVTIYEVELEEDEIDTPLEVPMQAKNTRLVIRVVPPWYQFSS
jgi:hypothetical protein